MYIYIYIYIYGPLWHSGYGALLQMYIYRDCGETVVKVLCYKCIYIGTAVGQWLKCCATNVYIHIGTAVAQWLWCCATNVYI